MRSVLELMSPLRKTVVLVHHSIRATPGAANGRAPREELGAHAPGRLEGVVAAYMVMYQALSRQDWLLSFSLTWPRNTRFESEFLCGVSRGHI